MQSPRAVLGSSTGRKWAAADWAMGRNHLLMRERFFGWVKSWVECLFARKRAFWRKTEKLAFGLVFGWRKGRGSIAECDNGVQVNGGTFERALLAVQGLR